MFNMNIKKMAGHPIGVDWIDNDHLVGDAKGAASKVDGEGIYPAIITAMGIMNKYDSKYNFYLMKKYICDIIADKILFTRLSSGIGTSKSGFLKSISYVAPQLYELYRKI